MSARSTAYDAVGHTPPEGAGSAILMSSCWSNQPERRCTPTIAAAGNNRDKRLSAIDRLWPLSIRPPHRVRQINHLGTLGTDHGTQLVNHRLQGGDFDPQRSDFLGKLTLHRLAFVGYLLGHRR
jgi:hypothetical protein